MTSAPKWLVLAIVTPATAWGTVRLEDGSGRVELIADGSTKGTGVLPGEKVSGTLRTGRSSRASLTTDDGAHLDLGDSSRASTGSTDAELRLESGHLSAQTGAHGLKISAGSGSVMVEGQSAQFDVGLTSSGVEVTSRKGSLTVHDGAKVVAVADGSHMTFTGSGHAEAAAPEDAPPAPAPAPAPKPAAAPAPEAAAPTPAPEPKPLSLKVSWPAGPVTSTHYTLKGATTPGAVVTVNGASATVKANGKFSAAIDLPEGESVVEVKASANGDDKDDSQKVTVAVAAPAPSSAEAPASDDAAKAGDAKADTAAPDNQDKPKKKPAKTKVKEEASGWE